jgi:peptide/nickel transport system substrate-binding protein
MRRLTKYLLSIILIIAFMFSVVGCGEKPASKESEAKEELVIALDKYGTTPNPPDGIGVHNVTMVYEPLIFLNKKFELQPGLITSWERIDDLTWKFKLRKGVKFHNGKEFDAESAKLSIAHWLDSSVVYLKGRVVQMVNKDSFQVKDKYTLEVKTKKSTKKSPVILLRTSMLLVINKNTPSMGRSLCPADKLP